MFGIDDRHRNRRTDLQASAGLQVDVPELDPAPPRGLALLAAGGDGPDQLLVVQEQPAHPRQGPEEGFGGHGYRWSRAVRTTIRISPTRAPGITSRR